MKQWRSELSRTMRWFGICAIIVMGICVSTWKSLPVRPQTVYVRNIPYLMFLGHVVETDGNLQLIKNFRLYDDDWRDGIWSSRVAWSYDPMEKINFRVLDGSQDRHGIILYGNDRKWRVIWFDFAKADRNRGRIEWKLVTTDDPTAPQRSGWKSANGEVTVFSRQDIQNLGIEDLIRCQNGVEQIDKENAKAFKRQDEEMAAQKEREKRAAKESKSAP